MGRSEMIEAARAQIEARLGHALPEDMEFAFGERDGCAETLDVKRPGLITVGVYVGDLGWRGGSALQPNALGRLCRMALGWNR